MGVPAERRNLVLFEYGEIESCMYLFREILVNAHTLSSRRTPLHIPLVKRSSDPKQLSPFLRTLF